MKAYRPLYLKSIIIFNLSSSFVHRPRQETCIAKKNYFHSSLLVSARICSSLNHHYPTFLYYIQVPWLPPAALWKAHPNQGLRSAPCHLGPKSANRSGKGQCKKTFIAKYCTRGHFLYIPSLCIQESRLPSFALWKVHSSRSRRYRNRFQKIHEETSHSVQQKMLLIIRRT